MADKKDSDKTHGRRTDLRHPKMAQTCFIHQQVNQIRSLTSAQIQADFRGSCKSQATLGQNRQRSHNRGFSQ